MANKFLSRDDRSPAVACCEDDRIDLAPRRGGLIECEQCGKLISVRDHRRFGGICATCVLDNYNI